MTDPRILIPEVANEDIEWVCKVMNLSKFDQPREDFLRERTTLDVSACPGSGKTTLIAAKLAIMAKKWPHRTKGICILSHTNAARDEIQQRLRGTVIGQQLFSYPHFIDTIHGFVNRFLALPFLNSNGFPPPTIGDDITTAYRRRIIGAKKYRAIEVFLKKKHSGFDRIRIRDRNLRFDIGRSFPAGPESNSYKSARQAIEGAVQAGYFCYDEMFVWANALLEDYPAVPTWLQHRFPLVIADEMQDTSDLQALMLDSIFPRSSSDVILQRVGDSNQTIYDGVTSTAEAEAAFPDSETCMKIPNSFRFGSSIATLTSPFAVDPAGPSGLQGVGPQFDRDASKFCSNAVFIFSDNNAAGVLDAYGQHILSTFNDTVLKKGDVTAVGSVHQEASDIVPGNAHFPKTVSHYWRGYTTEVARREAHPGTLIQYVRIAQALVRDRRDLSPGVERIAAGLVRFARHAGDGVLPRRLAPTHRALVNELSNNAEAEATYRRLLRVFLIDQEGLTETSWNERKADILLVTETLSGSGKPPNPADSFLRWNQPDPTLIAPASGSPQDAGPNVYRFADGTGRSVDIRLGSVHSVKGQTHLATLLLSTHWHDHSAKKILPWLLGKKINSNGAGARDRVRLRQTYVAMTRPSHLVSIAIPRSVLGNDAEMAEVISTLRSRGWSVAEVVDGAAHWQT